MRQGEYFFDDIAKRILFMPPGGAVSRSVFISAASTPLISLSNGVSFISIKKLRLMYGRAYAVATIGNVVSRGLRVESLDASRVPHQRARRAHPARDGHRTWMRITQCQRWEHNVVGYEQH